MVAVDVKEYRTVTGQEVLIGVTRRDLQLVVANCPAINIPALPPPAVLARDYTIEAGSTLTIPITATQADAHPLTMTLNSVLPDGDGGYNATLNGAPGTRPAGAPTGTAVLSGTDGTVAGTFVYKTSCDKTIMEGEQVVLEGKANGTYPVTWTPVAGLPFVGNDRLRPIASSLVTTTYALSAGAGKCADSSPVTVTPRVRVLTTISPSGDGQDATWEIDNIGAYAGNHVQVFTRWGSRVFDAASYSRNTEWNGTIGEQPAPVGTCYCVITLGNGRSYSGPVAVVY